jgi:hypothetical protein
MKTQPPPATKVLRRMAVTALSAALLAATATPGPACTALKVIAGRLTCGST